jgi:Flp pilus assembly protein TadG
MERLQFGARRSAGPAGAAKKAGQVTVELLLVLPIFMTLLFFIMEMGNLGFQTILAHHCAYELARIGSLVAGPNGGDVKPGEYSPDEGRANMKMEAALGKMFTASPGITVEGHAERTLYDQQAGRMNWDWVVTLHYEAKLIFPISSAVLSDPPKGSRKKKMIVQVRMPIEAAYFE